MKLQTWLNSEVGYGAELIRSAIVGGRSARDKALAPKSASLVLAHFARTSLPWAVIGASMSILALYSRSKCRSLRSAVGFGLTGAVIGFSANMALRTWPITAKTLHGALRNLNTVRDAHWLEKNPINYA
jgi:hypothetical protein